MVDYMAEFRASLARVTTEELEDRFFSSFYDRFIGADESIAAMFSGTDMEHQKKMLRESLHELMDFSTSLKLNNYIVTLARIHGVRGRQVQPSSYDLWLDKLVESVSDIDPDSNTNVELAWRLVLSPGVTFMKFYYDR